LKKQERGGGKERVRERVSERERMSVWVCEKERYSGGEKKGRGREEYNVQFCVKVK
jgi:hypothetical protein